MTTKELKEKYLKFFETKGHKIISGASLTPENDPTALFISAGMHPLVPYLSGEKHPEGKRLVNNQKCIRTGDIDEVGDDVHLTFFEMLGNWSLGDYWKKEAIEWSFEFLTSKKWLGLDKDKLAVSCFKGDPSTSSGRGAPRDEESAKIWQSLGIPKERIVFLGRKENWWDPVGDRGPCGPDTEMFYWSGPSTSSGQAPKKFDPQDSRWVEIWNDVFMQYDRKIKKDKIDEYKKLSLENQPIPENFYEYLPLKQKNVDTGMGVERTVAVLNGKSSVFDVEPLKSIIEKVRHLSGSFTEEVDRIKAERIIADHLRAATFIMGDEKGIAPSNLEQGYVVRRLIRRAIRYGKKIGINKPFTYHIVEVVIEKMGDEYSELKKNKDFIIEQLVQEEEKFGKTLERGLKEFEKLKPKIKANGFREFGLNADDLFNLYSTYGFPIELSFEELDKFYKEHDLIIPEDVKNRFTRLFQESLKKHQELSRTATAGKFKSGLADHSEQVTKLHTAAHLLLAALRKVLGDHVVQKGSNITAERLRLDFSNSEKLTPEQLKEVEDMVNEQIEKNLPISCCEVPLAEARKMGAMGVFESKYGDKVKVYTVGAPSTGSGQAFSCEICGGPHVEATGKLGYFRIKKEESSSAGVRRIKAILE